MALMKVKDVCYINKENLKSDTRFSLYKYLDTGNITQNVINEIAEFNNRKELPSRAKRRVQAKDIIISTVRPEQMHYGILENPDENLLVSTGFTVLTPKRKLVNEYYLYYYLTSEKITRYFQMIAESSVSSYPSITKDIIANVEVNFPPIEQQEKRAEIIKILDEKIVINNRLIKELEEYSYLLFYKWFVNFDYPNNKKGNQYNDEKISKVYTKNIPKGWIVKKFGEEVKITTGKKDANHSTEDGEYTFFTCSENQLKSPTFSFDTKAMILAGNGEFWLNRYEGKFEAYQRNYIIESKRDEMFDYLYMYLKKHIRQITKQSTGSIIQYLRLDMITDFKVIIPDDKTIKLFNTTIAPFLKQVEELKRENKLLKETRNLLIKKLIE